MKNEFKITQDNIHIVNKHLKKQYRINKGSKIAFGISAPLGSIVFFACCCLISYGILCGMDSKCADFPVLGKLWEIYCSYIPITDMVWYICIPVMLLTVYLPVTVLHLLIHGIVSLLFWSEKAIKEPDGSTCEQARTLAENHKKVISCSSVGFDEGEFTVAFCTISAVLISIGMMVILCLSNEDWVATLVDRILPVVIFGVLLWLVTAPYWVWLFQYGYGSAKDKYGKAIDTYWLENDPSERARREEAERLKTERAHQEHEEYNSWVAKDYARQKKENEEYKKRLHEWATGDDDPPTPGCGDGI